MSNKIIKTAGMDAGLTVLYVVLIATFLSNIERILGRDGKPDTILAPIAMLLLFILSAAITGSLVFGRPVLWYFDGKKQEALSLLGYTIGFLFIITIFALLVLFAFSN